MVAAAEMTMGEVLQRNVALFRRKFQHVAGSMDEVRYQAASCAIGQVVWAYATRIWLGKVR